MHTYVLLLMHAAAANAAVREAGFQFVQVLLFGPGVLRFLLRRFSELNNPKWLLFSYAPADGRL